MSQDRPLAALILAAGRGRRMESELPKVLHDVGGQPMIHWVVATAQEVGAQPIVLVVGHGRQRVTDSLKGIAVSFVHQTEQLGTAHAAEQARPELGHLQGDIVVLSGDVPGISPATVRALCQRHSRTRAKATLLTAELPDPAGYGRIMKDAQGHLLRVVEEADATGDERSIREINSGTYVFDAQALFAALPLVQNLNRQHEYYLPDVLSLLREQKQLIAIEKASNYRQILGVNTKSELRKVHAELFD